MEVRPKPHPAWWVPPNTAEGTPDTPVPDPARSEGPVSPITLSQAIFFRVSASMESVFHFPVA
jgi:hypothetical protein